ncbi:hypothetical protein [Aquimarina sp. AU474]|uniref:hypothetical protein n=1 Tax=Aquimarina sp. AU474 TaxID=2108529 RepID=UPI000D690D6D|nr:hypothetical protein [Aquimarina sp. AU474]
MIQKVNSKNWWQRNWKWVSLFGVLLIPVLLFFSLTGDATLRYGSIYLQPDLIENALNIASKNDKVIKELGELAPTSFFRLLEGEVEYLNNDSLVAVTVGIRSKNGKRAKIDILARKIEKKWEYQKIIIRIKKPVKKMIKILEL